MITTDTIQNISFMVVFIEGLLSFFSPCVLPMLPIYIGYLSGTSSTDDNKKRKIRLLVFTLCFILGIFVGIVLMHMTFSAFASFFQKYKDWIARLGGLLIILLGLHQLGLFKIKKLEQTFQLKNPSLKKSMNILVAFGMGFTFSFAWTPCIGPAMTSILVLSANASSWIQGLMLACLYALGLTLPFLLVGIFTDTLLLKLQSYRKYMNLAVKAGAVLMIVMGIWLFTSTLSPTLSSENEVVENQEEKEDSLMAPDISLNDLYGNEISLSDYQGKIVYLNFWGTWCPACQSELESLQELYMEYKDSDEVVVLTLINGAYRETGVEDAKAFMENKGLNFPVLYDETGEWFYRYGIYSYPTTFMIQPDGNVFGYVEGAVNKEIMDELIEMTRVGKIESNESEDENQ